MSKTLTHEHINEALRTRTPCACGAGYMQEAGMPCPNPKCPRGQGIGSTLRIQLFGPHPPGTPSAFSREKCFLSKDPDARVFWLWEPVR